MILINEIHIFNIHFLKNDYNKPVATEQDLDKHI